jgi:hypothetical protein
VRKILVDRYLPVLLAVIGTAGVAGDFNRVLGWGLATTLWVISLVLVVGQALEDRRSATKYNARLEAVASYLAEQIGEASTFEERLRRLDDMTAPSIGKEVEGWKGVVESALRTRLPGTHADVRFGKATGPTGRGDAVFEHGRLLALRGNLMAILDNLPAYVERSLK